MEGVLDSNLKKYVHITNQTKSGLIEFNFALGDPSLYVELALPSEQFEKFCKKNGVCYLNKQQEIDVENEQHKWKYGEIGTLKYKKEQMQ